MCLIDLSDSGCFTTSFAEQWRGSLGRKVPRKEVRTDISASRQCRLRFGKASKLVFRSACTTFFYEVSALSGAENPSAGKRCGTVRSLILHAREEEGVAGDGLAGAAAVLRVEDGGDVFGGEAAAADFDHRADNGADHIP